MINENLPAVVTDWREEVIPVGAESLRLTLPADPDRLLEDPETLRENRENDYMPYWGYLWPAAREMAGLVMQADWPAKTRVLELGCGSGLIGLAALLRGMQVTFTDNRPEALALAAFNARQNGLTDFQTRHLDWLEPDIPERFPVVIASDVLYEQKFHDPLFTLLPQLVTPGGEVWIGDPGRTLMLEFLRRADALGWEFELWDRAGQSCGFPRVGQFHLIQLRWEAVSA